MKRALLIATTLCIVAGLSATMAYVVVDALSGRSSALRAIGLLAFPVGLAVGYWAFSVTSSVRFPPLLGVLAIVIGIGAAQAGPALAVLFGSLILGVLLYVLGWMIHRLPTVARGQPPGPG